MSPWIVTLDALEPFRIPGPKQEPKVLPYLEYNGNKHFDINLDVIIKQDNGDEKVVTQSNYRHMYWNMNQQLAHHSVNGCDIRCGDLLASGTISGPEEGSYGSMLEISWKGTKPIKMPDGSERRFINDGDTVIMKGYSKNIYLHMKNAEACILSSLWEDPGFVLVEAAMNNLFIINLQKNS